MTYNLRVAAPRDAEPSWAKRRDAVASVIRFHDPDVVGVQEALPRMLDDLDARLPVQCVDSEPCRDGAVIADGLLDLL